MPWFGTSLCSPFDDDADPLLMDYVVGVMVTYDDADSDSDAHAPPGAKACGVDSRRTWA